MYNPCCHENAGHPEFRLCPECGTRLIRCPACSGLMTELAYCPYCVQPKLEMKCGMQLKEGGFCAVPAQLSNRGPKALRVRSLAFAVPGHQEPTALRAGFRLATADSESFSLPVKLDRAGEYAVELTAELDWEYGCRVGLCFKAAGVVVARIRDSLVNQGGTGNLVYVAGAASEMIAGQIREVESSAVPFRLIESRPLDVMDLTDYGDPAGAVTLATELELPDMLALSKGRTGEPIRLMPDPAAGVLLGRDRPGPDTPNHATLRIPGRIANASDLTRSLSSTHWKVWPSEGSWWIEVLGRRPTLVDSEVVERGRKVQLHEGAILCPLVDRPSALRLRLRHLERHSGRIVRSVLELV